MFEVVTLLGGLLGGKGGGGGDEVQSCQLPAFSNPAAREVEDFASFLYKLRPTHCNLAKRFDHRSPDYVCTRRDLSDVTIKAI